MSYDTYVKVAMGLTIWLVLINFIIMCVVSASLDQVKDDISKYFYYFGRR